LNRKVLIIIIISILSLTLISGIIYVAASRDYIHTDAKANDPTNTPGDEGITTTPSPDDINEVTLTPQEQEEVDEEIADFVPATKMDLEPSSITVFVNKEFCIPKKTLLHQMFILPLHIMTKKHLCVPKRERR